MKFNKISMVLAALAFVGCSSEDLNEFAATPAAEDSNLIQLGSDFVLAGVSAEGTTTRTHWEQYTNDEGKQALRNKFLPIYTASATFGSTLDADADLAAQAIGLCWLGNGAVGTDVYTNYEFYHFGWLNKGEKEAKFDCGNLTNGSLYSEIAMTTGTASAEAVPGTDWVVAGLPAKSVKSGQDNLDYNTGIYKTENKAIFGGQYIVYYPYNENFKDAGTIPATAVTNWPIVPMNYDAPEIGTATFRYSAPTKIEGGNQAANFGLKNLSALVRLRVAAPASDAYLGNTIDQIVLFSESKQLLKQANLAADKIAAGATGADLYASTEGTKTIVANSAFTLQAVNATPLASPYITVLPTTVDDLVVFVHNQNQGKWARVNLGKTEFKAGDAKSLTITVAKDDFTTDYIAVDENSLSTALNNAQTEIAGDPTARPTITVIGDITLGAAPIYYIDGPNDDKITIKGDDIIVPQDVTLNLKTIMQSNVRVLGKSCCTGALGGRLEVKGGTISNVTLEETEASTKNDNTNPELKYTGAKATVAAGKTVDVQAGNVIVNVAVEHKGDIKIAKDAKLTVNGTAGDLNFMGSNVTNNGTIEVMKNGNFDMTNSKGGATATDGKRMTNNGTFIHNVDAGVGTAVQSMVQNGEYRCKVDDQVKLDDAFLQWTACSVIEMVNTVNVNYNLGTAAGIATPYQHNGKYIDIEVNVTTAGVTTTFDNPLDATTNKADDKEIMIGNLTVKAGGLDIDYVNDDANPDPTKRLYFKRTLTVNGNMTVSANTTMIDSKKINVTGNLTLNKSGVTLTYAGNKANVEGLAVTKDIILNGNKNTTVFDASADDALNITCANFTLKKGTAVFGNRSDGAAKNLVVSGTIDNQKDGIFNILPANPLTGYVLAWVSCKELKVGGSFPNSRPRVVE